MGLYQAAKKLQMGCNDLDHLILRPFELHIVMAQLPTIGDLSKTAALICWIEADLHGPSTVKQIIDGNNSKTGQAAHMITPERLITSKARISRVSPESNRRSRHGLYEKCKG